ncbi:MAG: UDPGP type 1 family protein [Planctomycetota bacterium]
MPIPDELRPHLDATGQAHLLRFADELSDDKRLAIAQQLAEIDWDRVPGWIDTYVREKPTFEVPPGVEPAPYYPSDQSHRAWDREGYRAKGEALLRAGKVACFTVAGGQGSRLGYDGPKGCYPAGAVTGKPLFQIFAEGIRATGERFGATPPWYIMTSPLNHEATRVFFEQHDYFGLGTGDVTFFMQGAMPSFDRATGKILLAGKDQIATNPDGHGGAFKALFRSGAVADMKSRGVEHLSYFQVDNPTVRVADPVFIGLHATAPDSSGEMSSKMIPKAYAEEKVGLFCAVDGKVRVIEYSDLPMDRQRETTPDGKLKFLAGSIAIHMMSVAFVEKLGGDPAFALPFHRADKKIPHVDLDTGADVSPSEPNGVKLEQFVFDGLEYCESSIVLETDRVEEFAPIKNAEGQDSPASSARLQTQRAARWLEAAGVEIPKHDDGKPDCTIELSPLTALGPEHLKGKDLFTAIDRGAEVAV